MRAFFARQVENAGDVTKTNEQTVHIMISRLTFFNALLKAGFLFSSLPTIISDQGRISAAQEPSRSQSKAQLSHCGREPHQVGRGDRQGGEGSQ